MFPEPEKLSRIEGERSRLAEKIAQLEVAQRDAEARLPALEGERRAATEKLHEATRQHASLDAALKALQAQQEKLDTDSKLKDWVQAHGLERAERLWQAIRVDAGWDDAVEAALGVRLNAVKLADDSALPSLLRDAPPGNFAVFVERSAAEAAPASSRLAPLASVVSSARPGVLAYLRDALANVFILPEGEDGMALARVLPPGGLLVSKAGHLFARQGVVFHGPQSELHGVLQRQREIEELLQKHSRAGPRSAPRSSSSFARSRRTSRRARTKRGAFAKSSRASASSTTTSKSNT